MRAIVLDVLRRTAVASIALPVVVGATALGVVATVVLLPVTLPIAVQAARALSDTDRLLEELGAEDDDCGSFFVVLFVGAAVLAPLLPLVAVHGLWKLALDETFGPRRLNGGHR